MKRRNMIVRAMVGYMVYGCDGGLAGIYNSYQQAKQCAEYVTDLRFPEIWEFRGDYIYPVN